MKYYHNLYLSDELKEKKEGIIYKLSLIHISEPTRPY